MSRQLPLDLPHRASLARQDFVESDCNRAALAAIDAWPDWPSPVLVLVGPPGSGKSHLAEIWRAAAGAGRIAARDLDETRLAEALGGGVAVEDLHETPLPETALFHLLNGAAETGAGVLFTSAVAPAALAVTLPDLGSRLAAARLVEIGPPDDDLIRHVLAKLFADRQLSVTPAVIELIVRRMERSLETAREIVRRIDREALAESRAVTRPLAAAVLAGIADGDDFPPDA